jgi:hypothetical protein
MAAPTAALLAATIAWVSGVTGFTIPAPRVELVSSD